MSTKTIASSQQTIQEKQSTHRNQDDTFNNLSLSTYQHCIGVIRGEWFSYSDPKKLETICYGTAIALSKRVILTCAHTLYLEKKRRICNNISFILNQENGYMRQGQKIYRASDVNYIQLQQLTLSQTFMKKAIPEDLALVYLNEDLPLEDFPEVGLDISLNSKEVSVKDSLYISGYPSSQYFNKVQLKSIGFNRIDLQGTLEGIDANSSVIYHNLNTKTGHSGSAIFARNNQTEKPTIIGVHTHKGRLNNSGIILTEMLLKRIANYDIFFALNHTQYDASVKLPLKIRTAVFEDLSKQQKDLIQRKSGNYRFYQQKESQDSDDECSEIDMQLFGVECHLQIQEKNQELTVQNNSIKINSQIQPYYYSIQEFDESQFQAITKYTASQQSPNQRNQLKTTNINLRSKQRTMSGSDIEKNNLKKRNQLQINILQISQYLERINIFGQLLHSLNQQKCFEKIESISEDLLSNKNIGIWQKFYQAVSCDNYCQNYSLRIKERQLSL